MGILDTFKKKEENKAVSSSAGVRVSKKDTDNSKVTQEKTTDVKTKASVKSSASKTKKAVTAQKSKQILVRPVVTEKVTDLSKENKYVFEVHPGTNKIEIKKEMKRLYDVEPTGVAIINKAGKKVRYGRTTGVQKHWKKAIITLKKGDRIEVYNG